MEELENQVVNALNLEQREIDFLNVGLNLQHVLYLFHFIIKRVFVIDFFILNWNQFII
jgi:hypothetical protein